MTLEEARKAKSKARSRLNNAYWKFQCASSEYELACIELAKLEEKTDQGDNTNHEEPKLNPCPSCGMVFDFGDGLWDLPNGKFYIMCPDCEAMTPDVDSQEEAVNAWNNGDVVFPRDR